MNGARALASGMLVLAAVCVVPAVSLAQDSGTPAETTTTTTPATDPATPPPDTGTAPPTQPDKAPAPSGNDQSADQNLTAPADPPATTTTVSAPRGVARKASSTSVTVQDFSFTPSSVTINVGDTVTWHNSGQAPHNASADDGSFRTPDLNNGQSASHTFSSAGTFSYICTIHPNMHGTVRVLSASGSGGGGASSSSSGTSESSAVASPDAAGTSTTLPMTGLAAGALALTGLALLASGLLTRWAGSARRWLSLF
jgi:plastocyanin